MTLYLTLFWDGRASSLEQQALGAVENPIEMENTHGGMVTVLTGIKGYGPYFKEAFGSEDVTKERIAEAIAAYNNFTDSLFHSLGVGHDAKTKTFTDPGRSTISNNPADLGAFMQALDGEGYMDTGPATFPQ